MKNNFWEIRITFKENTRIIWSNSKRYIYTRRFYERFKGKYGANWRKFSKIRGHSRSNNAHFFSRILVTRTQQNFAHVLWIVIPVPTKSVKWTQRVLYSYNELERNSALQLRSIVRFLTIENNSGAEIHHSFSDSYGGENVMNLRNVQRWQLMFQEGRINIYDKQHKRQWSTMVNETVRCECAIFSTKSLSHYYWHVTIDGSTLFIRSPTRQQ